MRALPQQDHADLGLVDDDRTEDLRETRRAPGATDALHIQIEHSPTITKEKF